VKCDDAVLLLKGLLTAASLGMTSTDPAAQPTDLAVFAAGSLRAPMTEIAQAFEAKHPARRVVLTFGASGLLKDRIQKGEHADVFASANMDHPQALAAAGKATPPTRFARNALCALVAPGIAVTPDTLVERLLDPAVKLGTSTQRPTRRATTRGRCSSASKQADARARSRRLPRRRIS
jgi:molybdate transport system substrate-binding protein